MALPKMNTIEISPIFAYTNSLWYQSQKKLSSLRFEIKQLYSKVKIYIWTQNEPKRDQTKNAHVRTQTGMKRSIRNKI